MRSSTLNKPIAVIGATGHTGRFVLAELQRRGLKSILVARDPGKLDEAGVVFPESPVRPAQIEDPESLDKALSGAAAVINCAGPFLDTALPVVEAAFREQIHYLDVTAEQAVVQSIRLRDADARRVAVTVVPAAAFYGGLADLLATSVLDGSSDVDEITVAVALDSWHPTKGTRITGARNTVRRLVVRNGVLEPVENPQPKGSWSFPAPFGEQQVAMLPLSETITLSHHLKAETIESWINLTALRDVGDSSTPPPQPSDERGRSAQRFVMDVLVRSGERRRRASAFGRDIYAASAPIIVEALQRILAGDVAEISGVRSLGEIFDARAFLEALSGGDGLRVQYGTATQSLFEAEAIDART